MEQLSPTNYDFSGWATCPNLKCSDGRTIMNDAFKHHDGDIVPLVWNHQHNDPNNILGKALLHSRDGGLYAYCQFNDTEQGMNAKMLVEHGDISALSIYANDLKHNASRGVTHGNVREVSLVLAGANPGAFIDSIMQHGEESDDEAIIYTDEPIEIYHAYEEKGESKEETEVAEEKKAESCKTVAEIIESMNEEQKTVMYGMIGEALKHVDEKEENDGDENTDEEENEVKHNVFDNEDQKDVLSHSDMQAIFADAKRHGSLKESVLAHGIEDIETLFPEPKSTNNPPEWINREMGWVKNVMGAVHHTPFSRIKSMFADLTEDDARAKGYIKGNFKKEQVFGLMKRTTTPTTIYKKQKLDRDDVIDITDFDVVAWLKAEMRMMLEEELARAILVGDGRPSSSDDKINELNIRPIWTDDDFYTIKKKISVSANATEDQKAKAFIRACVKSRKEYKGSGNPTLYTTEDVLTDLLLLEDSTGRVIYETEDKLRSALRVSAIVTVPVMEGLKRTDEESNELNLMGIIVNLNDYNVGADKGGAVNMFDDFDIDYNAQKYLIETRCSGALIKPFSAIALEMHVSA